MKLKDLGEFGLISRLSNIIFTQDPDIIVNIGDDTACIKVDGKYWLLTVDSQVENVHFIKSNVNPIDIGWKLSTANVSDVVACGGRPKFSLISACLPKDLDVEFIENVYIGIRQAQDFYGFKTVGGNITSSTQIVLDMTLVGESSVFIPRDAAKPGQYIYLTGYTGLSKVGLEVILSGKKPVEEESYFIDKHFRPFARLDKLETILKYAKSSIDVSDGLVADLYHISDKSNVKMIIQKENIPVDKNLLEYCQKNKKDPYDYILYGGEDYQILFTSESLIDEEDIYMIGYVEEGKDVYLKDGESIKRLPRKGFNHLL